MLARVVEGVDQDLGLVLVLGDVVADLGGPDVAALVALADREHVRRCRGSRPRPAGSRRPSPGSCGSRSCSAGSPAWPPPRSPGRRPARRPASRGRAAWTGRARSDASPKPARRGGPAPMPRTLQSRQDQRLGTSRSRRAAAAPALSTLVASFAGTLAGVPPVPARGARLSHPTAQRRAGSPDPDSLVRRSLLLSNERARTMVRPERDQRPGQRLERGRAAARPPSAVAGPRDTLAPGHGRPAVDAIVRRLVGHLADERALEVHDPEVVASIRTAQDQEVLPVGRPCSAGNLVGAVVAEISS